jgi:glycosyltransferase involved in cell wall biosynthesis
MHVNDCADVAKTYMQFLPGQQVECALYLPTVGTYRVSRLRRALMPVVRMAESLKLRRRFLSGRFDLVHVHYATFAIMPLLAGLPFVVHAHGTDVRRDLYRRLTGPLVRAGLARARAVMYVTPDLRRHIEPLRPDAQFMPNPLDLRAFTSHEATEQASPSVLVISKLDRTKGIVDILAAIEQVWKVRPELTVAMFRFGDAREEAESFFARHRDNPSLRLLDYVKHEEMPELIRRFSIVVGQQNRNIGALGMSELEAMACGRPLVVRHDYPEAYGDPLPILESSDSEAIVRQLLALLDDPQRGRELGKRASAWVAKHHDGMTQAARLADVYAAAIARR